MVTVISGDGRVATNTTNIAAVAPGLFAANGNGQGVAAAVVLRVRADGTQTFEPVAVACENRVLCAFKWMRNSGNEAKQMWLETGKLKGLIDTLLMDRAN